MSILSIEERELIDAARMVLADVSVRLSERHCLFPTNKARADREAFTDAREAIISRLQMDYGTLRHEVAAALLIDAQGRLIDTREFPQGEASKVSISFRILAGWIVETGAVAVLLVHNHPSGECTPSRQDVELTARLKTWLLLMDCALIDHLVVTPSDCSMITGDWI
jgi:DNA repair protein RadC